MFPRFRLPLLVSTLLLLGSLIITSRPGAAQTLGPNPSRQQSPRQPSGFDPTTHLQDRVGRTSDEVLQTFREAGMAPRSHSLTAAERRLVARALAALPAAHQRVLKERLRRLSFLDNMPNTALTSTVESAPSPLFDITIRAAILSQTASQWLTEKERTCFQANDSTLQVFIEAGLRPALDYVLLHEATHVVDASLKINPAYSATGQLLDSAAAKPFTAGIWQDRTRPVPSLRHALLEQISFRRGGKVLPITEAAQVYAALARTPFVSLYGSAAWTEDLAEYVTVYHFTHQLQQPFRIVLRRKGQEILRYEPMKSTLVARRAKHMKRFYA